MTALDRLLRPRRIAVMGGGTWCANVIRECRKLGFGGALWSVHPDARRMPGADAFASVEALPGAPDAVFLGINRTASVSALAALAARGAGGAVCFASGFAEARAELKDGPALQADLIHAAGDMCVLGPNCYGFLNALDGVALWPDQHGLVPVPRGVAILSQSSNLALNLTMQRRGLPIGFLGTVGNQAQTDLAGLGTALLEDDRISALGLYIEGIADAAGFERMARRALALGKSIVALKTGRSAQAHAAAISHTASLAGSRAGAEAFLRRCGVAEVRSPGALIEALKILHVAGPLQGDGIASMSCSGGEAALMADMGAANGVAFPVLDTAQSEGLRAALGPRVALANPLDYHTYVWADRAAMTAVFAAMMARDGLALGCVVLDFPRADRCDPAEWPLVVDAVEAASRRSGRPMAILSSLADTLPEATAQEMMARGIVPLCGFAEALDAISACLWLGAAQLPERLVLSAARRGAMPGGCPAPGVSARVLEETEAKALLAAFGVPVPRGVSAAHEELAAAAAEIGFPVVLKGRGMAHKTDAGAVRLGLRSAEAVRQAAQDMTGQMFLVEAQIEGAVAELCIGVLRDDAHGFVLSLAAGGVWTEILNDSTSLILPVSADEIDAALGGLRIAPLLAGYRGGAAADRAALVRAVCAVQDCVMAHTGTLEELEINPLLCLPTGAVAADALIRLEETQ